MKTSVWLDDETGAEWKASGLPLAELVKRGLKAAAPEPLDEKIARLLGERIAAVLERLNAKPDTDEVRRIVRDELERVAGQSHT
jgi:hypothetical protein